MAAPPDAEPPPDPVPAPTRWVAAAAILSAVSLFAPLSRAGLWDPHELRFAELSRRIGLNLLGGTHLVVEGAVNSVPTLGELARGQLPFTSAALGFRWLGLHEWAGRLPLALWGALGVLAIGVLVARLADRVSAAMTAVVLATTPLYFVQARTMLGDIVTLAGFAVAIAGLGLAIFDRAARPVWRCVAFAVGLAGAGIGFASRGVLLGVAVPLLAAGVAWGITAVARPEPDRLGRAFGAFALAIGAGAASWGGVATLAGLADTKAFDMAVGAALEPRRVLPTHDGVIHQLGHALFPWSAVVPFALGRCLAAPARDGAGAAAGEVELRALAAVAAIVATAVHGLLLPVTGGIAFVAVAPLAALVALFLRDFQRGAQGSRALALGVAAFLVLFASDFKNLPEKGLAPFVVEGATFPASFTDGASKLVRLGALVAAGAFAIAFLERPAPGARRWSREEYLRWPRTLRTALGGNLLFSLAVVEVLLVAFSLAAWLQGAGLLDVARVAAVPALVRQRAPLAAIALPLIVLLGPAAALAARDAARAVFDAPRGRLPVPGRATAALLAFAGLGLVMSLGYYPALAAQISPKEVFDTYRRVAKPGEELALLGVGSGSASYHAGREVPTFNGANEAFDWLMAAPSGRRWLALRSKDLPQVNSLHRGRTTPARNVAVLDARSSEILLVSNTLSEGETTRNPFDAWISSDPPNPTRKVDGNFGGQLDAIGWDVTTPGGDPVGEVRPGTRYQFRVHYKVVAPISGNWETFIHIDGFQRRFNGDHKTLEDRYPFHLWRVGDYVTDIHPFVLEPNFSPGEYRVFYGLFMGNKRLEVKRGKHHEDRLDAGPLVVK
ncbi:MAG: hypothetical protein IT376_05400 [Polyangiaceae bacterium]|nr:hypothetical protein [Polyangiaceae bacterium]